MPIVHPATRDPRTWRGGVGSEDTLCADPAAIPVYEHRPFEGSKIDTALPQKLSANFRGASEIARTLT
jgi:hypothetical protein